MRDPDGRVVGATFLRNNLGKRSIGLDLKSERGRDLFLQLVPRSTSWPRTSRPGRWIASDSATTFSQRVIRGDLPVVLGLRRQRFAVLVMARVRAIVEAMSGIYEYLNPTGQPPRAAPVGALGDISAALFATIGVLAALRHRDATGEGQQVDIAMYDAAVAMTDIVMNFARSASRSSRSRSTSSSTRSAPPTAGSSCNSCASTSSRRSRR